MPPIPLDTACQMASRHGYDEIYFNKQSRIISFRKEGTRINVYYTTGTVGICLEHPRNGKSQDFRRDQSPEDLEAIFRNPTKPKDFRRDQSPEDLEAISRKPRIRTGVAYYSTKTNHGGGNYWCCTALPSGQTQQYTNNQRWRYDPASSRFGILPVPQQQGGLTLCQFWNPWCLGPGGIGKHIWGSSYLVTRQQRLKPRSSATLFLVLIDVAIMGRTCLVRGWHKKRLE
jgi:hypothetical protein